MGNEQPPRAASGPGAAPTEDELRRDEATWIARLHGDACDVLLTLADRTGKVASLVEQFGPADCREMRLELQRFTRFSLRLVEPQFADLRR